MRLHPKRDECQRLLLVFRYADDVRSAVWSRCDSKTFNGCCDGSKFSNRISGVMRSKVTHNYQNKSFVKTRIERAL